VKVYPAKFVGETTYPAVYDAMRDGAIGDVMFVARTDYNGNGSDHGPYAAIRCGCGVVDLIALAPYKFENGASWQMTSREPVHIDPSILRIIGYGDKGSTRCHYFVHAGQLQMLDDTTAPLK
jgi:hypothetical protein